MHFHLRPASKSYSVRASIQACAPTPRVTGGVGASSTGRKQHAQNSTQASPDGLDGLFRQGCAHVHGCDLMGCCLGCSKDGWYLSVTTPRAQHHNHSEIQVCRSLACRCLRWIDWPVLEWPTERLRNTRSMHSGQVGVEGCIVLHCIHLFHSSICNS